MAKISKNNKLDSCSPGLAELVGIIIGDGFIHKHKNSYTVGVVGSPVTDKDYFEVVVKLIRQVWGKKVGAVERARGLRITFGSK